MAPPSQKASERPISFRLVGVDGQVTSVSLVIRPEDLTRGEPSLINATPTFDGAWIDAFGPNLGSIQISGHTGWNLAGGWEENFARLRSAVFTEWHRQRAQAVSEGKDAAEVKLIFADALDNITAIVAPAVFTLKRNKASPLLMMYQINLIVAGDLPNDIASSADLESDLTFESGIAGSLTAGGASLADSLGKITKAAGQVRSFIDSSIAAPVRGFMDMSATAFSKVVNVANTGRGLIQGEAAQLIDIARDVAMVGRNAFYAYNAVASLPAELAYQVSAVGNAYGNAFCVLRNAFNPPNTYPDFSDLYGASYCSSTVGGSPLSPLRNGNPFETIVPTVALPPGVSRLARSSIEAARVMDPVLSPPSMASIGSILKNIGEGVSF